MFRTEEISTLRNLISMSMQERNVVNISSPTLRASVSLAHDAKKNGKRNNEEEVRATVPDGFNCFN